MTRTLGTLGTSTLALMALAVVACGSSDDTEANTGAAGGGAAGQGGHAAGASGASAGHGGASGSAGKGGGGGAVKGGAGGATGGAGGAKGGAGGATAGHGGAGAGGAIGGKGGSSGSGASAGSSGAAGIGGASAGSGGVDAGGSGGDDTGGTGGVDAGAGAGGSDAGAGGVDSGTGGAGAGGVDSGTGGAGAGGVDSGTGGASGSGGSGGSGPDLDCAPTGAALSFDGAKDRFSLPQIAAVSFTIELWVRTSTHSRGGSGFNEGNGLVYADTPGFHDDYGTSIINDHFALGMGQPTTGGDITIQSTSSIVTGDWVHVAAVRDTTAKTISVYVNGVAETTAAIVNVDALTNASTITVGADAISSFFYDGDIDDLRIWNTARTTAEIKADMTTPLVGNETGLAAYYRFDEDAGLTVHDSSTAAATATLGDTVPANAPTWIDPGAPICVDLCMGGSALSFDGQGDRFSLPQLLGDSFTIEAWMQTSTQGRGGTGFNEGSGFVYADTPGFNNDYGTAILGDKFAFGMGQPSAGGDITIHSVSSVVTGKWVHVAAVRDVAAASISIYVNGVAETTATIVNFASLTHAPNITVGADAVSNFFYTGLLDDLQLWTTARTATEIQADMARPLVGNEAGLAAYYRFDEDGGTTLHDSSTAKAKATLGDGTAANVPTWVTAGAPLCQ